MSCSHLLVTKKQNLRHHERRLSHRLHLGLEPYLGGHPGGPASHVDNALMAKWYFSEAFDVHALLWFYFDRYEISQGRSDTYSVEGDNAKLRHYLAHLTGSCRCFSRCPYALYCAVCLFVYCHKRRQYHPYSFHLIDFVKPPI
jgi:hypothetical protein